MSEMLIKTHSLSLAVQGKGKESEKLKESWGVSICSMCSRNHKMCTSLGSSETLSPDFQNVDP